MIPYRSPTVILNDIKEILISEGKYVVPDVISHEFTSDENKYIPFLLVYPFTDESLLSSLPYY